MVPSDINPDSLSEDNSGHMAAILRESCLGTDVSYRPGGSLGMRMTRSPLPFIEDCGVVLGLQTILDLRGWVWPGEV